VVGLPFEITLKREVVASEKADGEEG
jgi:hypothetical protein